MLFVLFFHSEKPKAVKNIQRTALGEKLGRIHMKPQNLDKMGGRRVSALRDRHVKKRPSAALEGKGGAGGGSQQAQKRQKKTA